jgi:hypothetical protein
LRFGFKALPVTEWWKGRYYRMYARARIKVCSYNPSSLPMKKKIGVEELLVWAYREQMVHGARPDDLPAELAMRVGFTSPFASWNFGAPADSSKAADGGYTAHADAWRVHAAVLALAPLEEVWPESHMPKCGVARDLPWLKDGMVTVGRRSLVFRHALNASRPDWAEDADSGFRQGRVVYGPNKRALFCEVMPPDLPYWEVARTRFVYWAWADALRELRESLSGMLNIFELSSELPEEKPWEARIAA